MDFFISWVWQYVTHHRNRFATGLTLPYIYNISEDATEVFAFTNLNIFPFHKSQLSFSYFTAPPLYGTQQLILYEKYQSWKLADAEKIYVKLFFLKIELIQPLTFIDSKFYSLAMASIPWLVSTVYL